MKPPRDAPSAAFQPENDLLPLAPLPPPSAPPVEAPPWHPCARDLRLDVDDVDLGATLVLPACARGLVLLAHVGGGHRERPRDRLVGRGLLLARVGTLAIDLLADGEDAPAGADLRHVALLSRRLRAVAHWAGSEAGAGRLRLGLFGNGNAVPAAVLAAAEEPGLLAALVACGGRPDLAARWLPRLSVPTLLMLGLGAREGGAFDARAARLAVDWIVEHLS